MYYLFHLFPLGLWVLTAFGLATRAADPLWELPPALAYLRRHQRRHARVLGIWALGCLLGGIAGMALTPFRSTLHQFGHMTAAWGSINLPIAVWLDHRARQLVAALKPATRRRQFSRFLLLNLGLDLLYLGSSLWLAGRPDPASTFLYHGLGYAVGVQGAALLALDGTSWALLQRRAGSG